ncbi:MAG: SDR family oxidoreductase [Deltaproteobacteria bacterium]|nr:SDR family oxidoreductase [Deltaproteobacteria bacterium]
MAEIVVITGGTAGVGRATAERFAMAGAKLAILARGQDRLDAAKRELERLGSPQVLALPCDVANANDVFVAADRIEAELGPIDIWINDAMTTVFGRFQQLTPEEFTRVTEVTYLGFVWGTRAALDKMIPRNRGTIVQVGSALAYRSIPLQSAYCGAKHAMVGFTDSIRSELIHDGHDIHLTCVHLPAVNTPQFGWCENKLDFEAQPVPPIYEPEVIARAIFDAAHARKREIYLGWPTVKAIFGQQLAPGLADRYLAKHFDAQFTDRPREDTPRNLFRPVPKAVGAHGEFDARARKSSWVARATTLLGAGGVTLAFHATVTALIAGTAILAVRKLSR